MGGGKNDDNENDEVKNENERDGIIEEEAQFHSLSPTAHAAPDA